MMPKLTLCIVNYSPQAKPKSQIILVDAEPLPEPPMTHSGLLVQYGEHVREFGPVTLDAGEVNAYTYLLKAFVEEIETNGLPG